MRAVNGRIVGKYHTSGRSGLSRRNPHQSLKSSVFDPASVPQAPLECPGSVRMMVVVHCRVDSASTWCRYCWGEESLWSRTLWTGGVSV